jgi:leucyl aminopeptidase
MVKMQTSCSRLKGTLSNHKEDRADLVLIVFADEPLSGPAKAADELTSGLISRRIELSGFEAKRKECLVIDSDLTVTGLNHIILVGLGPRNKLSLYGLREALAEGFTQAKERAESEHIIFPIIDVDLRGFTVEQFTEVLAEYAILVDYELNHRKTRAWPDYNDDDEPTHLKSLHVLCTRATLKAGRRGVTRGKLLGQATCKARNWVNEPSDELTPTRLSEIAREIADESKGQVSCKVLRKPGISQLKMGAFLAVNNGSKCDPALITLSYDPPTGATEKVIALIGKGVTFDSGGLTIKDVDSMQDMKMDMAGAAAVLSVMSMIPRLKPRVSVRAVIAATDNLIDSLSMRPGDIVTTMSGLTVEIQDTDCEGRLTLVDAITYAQQICGATHIIDLATLTGGIEDALGNAISGVFGNSTGFSKKFLSAANRAGELMHELPVAEIYRKGNKSTMADLTNNGEGPQSIIAAWFLREFVEEEVEWLHVDIAGTAFYRDAEGVNPEGGTGVGVRTLAHFLLYL